MVSNIIKQHLRNQRSKCPFATPFQCYKDNEKPYNVNINFSHIGRFPGNVISVDEMSF